jgi:hypothetical protein
MISFKLKVGCGKDPKRHTGSLPTEIQEYDTYYTVPVEKIEEQLCSS